MSDMTAMLNFTRKKCGKRRQSFPRLWSLNDATNSVSSLFEVRQTLVSNDADDHRCRDVSHLISCPLFPSKSQVGHHFINRIFRNMQLSGFFFQLLIYLLTDYVRLSLCSSNSFLRPCVAFWRKWPLHGKHYRGLNSTICVLQFGTPHPVILDE